MKQKLPEGKILIQFDGMCILCSRAIQFIMKADKRKKFVFQALQQTSEEKVFETIIITDRVASYQYFDGVLRIGYELGGIYRLVAIFKILPLNWRNKIYLWVAKNRLRWFGRREFCYLPTPEEMERFI